MNIKIIKNIRTDDMVLTATISRNYIIDLCEPYGSDELCSLISPEQGMAITRDAILMALHLKLKPITTKE